MTIDTLIIGGGPAGLAVANTLAEAGLEPLVIERGPVGHHISQYPTFMQFLSTRDLLEIGGFPLTITEEKPSRRQYLAYLSRFAADRRLPVRTYTSVEAVEPRPAGGFRVTIHPRGGAAEVLSARAVVVACGAFENPRMLGVPGEDLEKVTHRFTEPHPYAGHRVLIVGGRNSAIETALILWRSGADVTLSYRREALRGHGIKYWLLPDIENRLKNGEIHGCVGTTVRRIDWRTVTLARSDGTEFDIANDFVICHTGYDPPVGFLRSMGIEVEDGTNIPRHDPETLETNVPGLFVAGTIIAGNVSGRVFIENSRYHGELILKGLNRAAAPA
ncbi:YpdA family putative bacillithiol disulfide reductase [Candidatus Poribacteria bacterium]|nr:YpdA family putative bacillithiol disulfide reductase [Candidatus Poribacteria bacterium]